MPSLTGCFLSTFKQISDAKEKLVIVFKWQQVTLKQNTECATIFRKEGWHLRKWVPPIPLRWRIFWGWRGRKMKS